MVENGGRQQIALGANDSDLVVVLPDEQVAEPCLVHRPAENLIRIGVDPGGIRHEIEEAHQGVAVDGLEGLELLDLGVNVRQLASQALLLLCRDVVRHDAGHGLLGPLEALSANRVCSPLKRAYVPVDGRSVVAELLRGRAGSAGVFGAYVKAEAEDDDLYNRI